ncbi:MAG: alpha/beta hydrolase, partial [Lentisphaeria bacterium]|nr:alpha/beta hydrolase [Lentisphaeria bacterium]
SKPVGVEVQEHDLGWTGEESDDYKCFLYGRIPSPGQGLLAKASVNVPIGQRLRMKAEWTGMASRPSCFDWEYDAPLDAGCKVLNAMTCAVCGMERRIDPDPMPNWNSRVLYHRNCYFTPDVSDEEYPVAWYNVFRINSQCRYGGAYFWESAALNLDGTGADSWNREYNTVCNETGQRKYTFRKKCLPVTVHKDDYYSNLSCGRFTLNPDIALESCGEGSFTYHVNTVGIGDLTAARTKAKDDGNNGDASGDGGSSEKNSAGGSQGAPLVQCVVMGDAWTKKHYLFVPSKVAPDENPAGRRRASRPAATVTFTAVPEGGDWPTEADYPTGDYPANAECSWIEPWKFPKWRMGHNGNAASALACPCSLYESIYGIRLYRPEVQTIAESVNSRANHGKGSLDVLFDGGTGSCTVTAECHADDCCWMDGTSVFSAQGSGASTEWNSGLKTWNVLVCDIRVDLLDDNVASPLPVLLLNDDFDDDAFVKQKLKAKETYWTDKAMEADREKTGPISYADNDLKAVRVTVPDVFGGDRELLKRLWIRVRAENGIRLHGDAKKNAPDASRWVKEGGDGTSWLFRVLPDNGDARFDCQLYAEGTTQGKGKVTAELLLEDPAAQDAQAGCSTIVSDTMDVHVIRVALVPDYGRDGAIDDADRLDALKGRPLRMWYNDNTDIDGFNLWDFEDAKANVSFWKSHEDFLGSAFGGVNNAEYHHPETNKYNPNCNDGIVNGRGDLLDLFPVWLDAKDFLILNGGEWEPQVALSHARNEIQAVYSDLAPGAVKDFRHQDGHRGYSAKGDDALHEASVHGLGEEFPAGFLDECRNGNGVLLCEGHSPTDTTNESRINAVFQLVRKNADGSKTVHTVGRRRLNTSVSPVSAMYRYYSLRGCEKDPAKSATRVNGAAMPGATGVDVSEPANMPDNETDPVYFAFVHGFNVDEKESGNWQGRMFKRLYQTGANVRLVGIDWNGDYSCQWNYHTNAEHAFRTAGALKECVTELASKGGKVFLLGHSLGNMLVSSAIVDHTMAADGFFMLNAAVAAEAYDPARHNTSGENNPMVPLEWRSYEYKNWSAGWHSLFGTGDDRSRLTWKGRFEAMLHAPGTGNGAKLTVYNYYDSEDEVIGTAEGELGLLSGFSWRIGTRDFGIADRQLAWHKQEFTKGCALEAANLVDAVDKIIHGWNTRTDQQNHETLAFTDEAGWGFYNGCLVWDDMGKGTTKWAPLPAQLANKRTKEECRVFDNAVFRHNPAYMGGDPDTPAQIPQELQDHLLAFGIPALSSSAGSESVGDTEGQVDLKNLKKGWPRNGGFVLEDIWAHSDYMLVPYFYNYQLYEEIKTKVSE